MTFFGAVWCGPRTNRLEFGSDLDQDLDPWFLNLEQDLDTEIFHYL